MSNNPINEGYFNLEDKSKDVIVRCKKCGGNAPAKDFRIDDETGVMVCPNCFNSFSIKKDSKPKKIEKFQEVKEKPKTIVIHSEEEVSRSFLKEKKEKKPEVRKKDHRVRYVCDKCGYSFKYDPVKDWPRRCPSCARKIENIRRGMSLIY